MKKLNNKGFVLAETMVVAVFIMTIFGIIFINFYPLMAQYEKREFYDDIDSKYDDYWFKRIIENKKFVSNSTINSFNSQLSGGVGRVAFTCSNVEISYRSICQQYWNASGIQKLYFTGFHLDNSTVNTVQPYDILNGKNHLQTPSILNYLGDEDLIDYVRYLPKYNYGSLNGAKYRIVAEFNRTYHSGTYKSFSTIEVIR